MGKNIDEFSNFQNKNKRAWILGGNCFLQMCRSYGAGILGGELFSTNMSLLRSFSASTYQFSTFNLQPSTFNS
jgi:hypothetical protein